MKYRKGIWKRSCQLCVFTPLFAPGVDKSSVVSVSIHPGIRNEVLPSRENIDKGQNFLDYNRGEAGGGGPIISDRDVWGPRGSDNSPPPPSVFWCITQDLENYVTFTRPRKIPLPGVYETPMLNLLTEERVYLYRPRGFLVTSSSFKNLSAI